jgi:hypothetical protein
MKKQCVTLIVVAVTVVMFTCSSSYGLDELSDTDKWNIEFTPYFWAAELKGDKG